VDLVERAAVRLAEAAAARGVRVAIEASAGGEGAMLEGDAELLSVALDYVLGLAVTRSRDRPVRVEVSSRGGAPVVVVTDEAGAPPNDVIARLLEPFGERAAIAPDPVAPRRRERLGLGLAIARGILEAHGGGLAAEATHAEPAGPSTAAGAPHAGAAAGLRFTCALGRARPDEGRAGPPSTHPQ
ncbi:MAG: HAMP domain-containing histidine kinase, partial [Polyangiaceae bacterium]|nr:HAMP domain-containing histidine kinase [Polyangiaceae bacterium]